MKRRRTTAIVLALALLLSLLPASALAATRSSESWCNMSPDGEHTWSNWLIRKEATCSEKGERYRTCRHCGYEQTESIKKTKHDYGKWKTTREATCSREGERVRKCKVCDHEDKQKLERLPHTFGAWTVLQPASCTETGSREHTCKVCGETVRATIDMLPHNWGGWEVVVEATDHSKGTRRRTCQVCGTEETEDFEPEGTLHRGDKGDDVKELQEGLICYGVLNKGGADGDYGGGTERAVRQVQEQEGLEPDGIAWPQTRAFAHHKFGEWKTISKLTRTTDGIRERVCERCGLVQREVSEARPILHRGDRGKQVEVIQNIIWDLGYDPGRIDGIFGPMLDGAIIEWSRDHDWYYEPGLLKPIDIDRIVGNWVEIEADLIGVSGANTPVNLQIEITPDYNMLDVYPGQSVPFNYTVTNLGTEDCTLGPLFISYGEDTGYRADEKRYRQHFIGDLSGEVLKAGGANSYNGSFTISADMDRAELDDPKYKSYHIRVNAWVLGTSLVDSRRWYSNIDWARINIYPDESTLDENLVLTGRVLDEQDHYTLGDEFEFEATLTNNTGRDLNVTIEGYGQTIDGALPITDEEAPVLLKAGETMTRSWPHRLCYEDEIRQGRYGFWLEAHGQSDAGDPIVSPQVSLWVNVEDPYVLASDALVLSRESDDPKGTRYHPGEMWRYRYRAANNGEAALSDVNIRAYLCEGFDWIPLNEAEVGTVDADAHGDLEGEYEVSALYTTDDYIQNEDGAWIREWGYDVYIVAQGVTPDGEVVYAKPLKDRIPIDFDDEDYLLPPVECLELTAELVNPKDEYAEGEEAEVKVTLKNLGDAKLTDFYIEPFIYPDYRDDVWDEPGSIWGKTWLNAGNTWTKTISIPLSCLWATDHYNLVLTAYGTTDHGQDATSNAVKLPVTVLADDGLEKHSLPIPTDKVSKTYSGGAPVPDGAIGQQSADIGWRSLTVVKQTKADDAYYDNAKIPVLMRLTIDAYDEYDFLGIKAAPGDSVSDESWMHGTLRPGQSYDFTYTMVLDPEQTGWKTRTVTANLHSHSLDADELESCEVRPPWVPAKVTIEDPNVHIINDNMSYLYIKLIPSHFKNQAYPYEVVDIPFAVDSDGNTPIKNVTFHCLEKLNGETTFAWSGQVRNNMNPGDTFTEWRSIRIKGTEVGQPSGYSLEMYLTGTIYNRKGKKEEIRSLPVEVPFTVLNPAGGKKILEFTSRLVPSKANYSVNDQVDIHFTVENRYREDLIELQLDCLGMNEPFGSMVSGGKAKVNGNGNLANGEKAEIVLHYTIKPEDVAKKQLVGNFVVTGRPIGGEQIRSRRIPITIHINDANLPKKLTITASCAGSGPFKAGAEQYASLKVTNNADQRVVRVRVYAVGDNRFVDHDEAMVWHDCGHGVKGWLCGECASIEPGSSVEFSNFFKIPSSYVGKGYFNAQWVVEADLADYRNTVGSNVATVTLEVQQAEDALDLMLTSISPVQEVYDIGQNVNVSVQVENPAGTIPEDLQILLATESRKDNPYKGYITATKGGWAYGIISFAINEADVVDGIWHGQLVARGFDGKVESEPLPFTLPVKLESGKPVFDIDLKVDQLNECPNPGAYWYTGDKIQAQVTATYKGEGPLKDMAIQVTRDGSDELVWTTSAANTSEVKDTFETTLDASLATENVLTYKISAWGSLEDPEVPDCFSETKELVITRLFGSPEDLPEEPTGDSDGGEKETQINWDAIHAAQEATEAESKADGTGKTEASDGGEAKPDDGGASEASDGGEAKPDDGGASEASDGGEAKSDDGGASEASDGGGSASTGGFTGSGADESPDDTDEPTYSGTVNTYAAAEACMYALAGQGADGATLCETHSAVADAVSALLEGAEDDLGAWQQAEALWMEALNAEYDALLAEAGEEATQIIEAERETFLKWMDTLKTGNDDPVYAEWKVYEQLTTQVAALCELRHTAPAAPEGLPDLDNAEAQTEASAQKAFEAWTGAHRALLGLLYPDSPTLIEAILSVR